MVVKSKHSIDIPQCSLPTLIFGSPHEPLPKDKGCLFDHLHPETRFLSRHTYRLWAQRLATGLRAAGLQRGDRVVVFSTNHLFYPVIFMGVIMAGGIFSGCNPTYSRQELAHQIRDADPAFVFTQGGEPLRICREAIKSITTEQHRSRYEKHTFVADDRAFDSLNQPGEQGLPYWSSLFASEAEGSRFVWDSLTGPNEAKNTIVALNYSSGTTGLSKGVEITHGNYVSNIVQYDYITATVDPVYDAEVKRTQKLLCFLPLYHAMAQMLLLGVAQYRGAPVYIMEKFDFLTVLQNVEKFRITDLTLVPPVVVMLAKRPETKKFDLSSVVRLGSGAAPLSREVSEEAENLWPKGVINIKQGWGMTEVTCSLLGWEPNQISTDSSVGWPNPNSEAKIMTLPDETADSDDLNTRKELGPNQSGELWVRGPQVMRGYWKNPKATANTLTPDGWLRTGDIAYYDKEEKFFIAGRLKELIKVKGLQVAPAELDGVCLECDGVADAAVVGVTIDNQEHPRAYIVLQQGVPATKATAEKIVSQSNAKLSQHKRLTGGIVFVDTLPKNPSGKILRRLLRDQAQKEVQAEQSNKKIKASL